MAYPSPVGVASKAFTGGTITIGFADLPAGTAIGDSILADPERFAAMVAQVAGSNTAKGPLTYLADALKAAEQT